jgi:hypothetical protein
VIDVSPRHGRADWIKRRPSRSPTRDGLRRDVHPKMGIGRTLIRLTNTREQRFDDHQAASGAGSRARALDAAAEHHLADLRAKGELMTRLADGERLAPHEIAAILSTSELSVAFETTSEVGPDD